MSYSSLKFVDSIITRGSSKTLYFTDKGLPADASNFAEAVFGLVFTLDEQGRAYVKMHKSSMAGIVLSTNDSCMFHHMEFEPWFSRREPLTREPVLIPDAGRHCIHLGDTGGLVGLWRSSDALRVVVLPHKEIWAKARELFPTMIEAFGFRPMDELYSWVGVLNPEHAA